MTYLSATLLLLNICAEALFLSLSAGRQDSLFRRLRSYTYWLLASDLLGGLLAVLSPGGWRYFYFYWSTFVTANLLLCLVALEITSRLLRDRGRFLLVWCIGGVVVLAAAHVRGIPTTVTAELVNLSLAADYVAGLILAVLLWFSGLEWSRDYLAATMFTGVVICGDVLCSLRWLSGYPEIALYGLPLVSLVAMVTLSFGMAPART